MSPAEHELARFLAHLQLQEGLPAQLENRVGLAGRENFYVIIFPLVVALARFRPRRAPYVERKHGHLIFELSFEKSQNTRVGGSLGGDT